MVSASPQTPQFSQILTLSLLSKIKNAITRRGTGWNNKNYPHVLCAWNQFRKSSKYFYVHCIKHDVIAFFEGPAGGGHYTEPRIRTGQRSRPHQYRFWTCASREDFENFPCSRDKPSLLLAAMLPRPATVSKDIRKDSAAFVTYNSSSCFATFIAGPVAVFRRHFFGELPIVLEFLRLLTGTKIVIHGVRLNGTVFWHLCLLRKIHLETRSLHRYKLLQDLRCVSRKALLMPGTVRTGTQLAGFFH